MGYVIGEALAELRKLPAGFAQTCVTSPPYWGLRDYGTAQWRGGEPSCDHLAPLPGGFRQSTLAEYTNGLDQETVEAKVRQRRQQYRDACARCGAVRVDQQLGLEPTVGEYVQRLVEVLREVRRVLRDDGTLWLNLGDCYANGGRGGATGATTKLNGGIKHQNESKRAIEALGTRLRGDGLKPKDLVGAPWRVALALQADGWWLRSDIVWSKRTAMPESVTDRPTHAHEYVFLLTKSERYYYDADAIKEPVTGNAHARGRGVNPKAARDDAGRAKQNGSFSSAVRGLVEKRNKRTVWHIAGHPYKGAHFACFPPKLIEPCILAGSGGGALVLDPFLGSGTTGAVAEQLGRQWFGIELNPAYEPLIRERTGARAESALGSTG